MFSALNPEELEIVIGAMNNVKKQAGELVIKEGDDGDFLYVIESGVLDCTKLFVTYTQVDFIRKEMKILLT